jgi:hypothetical protein
MPGTSAKPANFYAEIDIDTWFISTDARKLPLTKTMRKFLTLFLSIALANLVHATSFIDVQANNPQVAGDLNSNTTAKFPTNKQNEPTIAVNPADPSHLLLAGANDEQREPPCGPGPVRGLTAPANDCSFFPGIGQSGVYASSDGGLTWTNMGVLDDQAAWQASPFVSDGDPVIVYGPKPDGNGGFLPYTSGARAYYASLASYKAGQSPFTSNPNKFPPELIVVSYSDNNGVTWSAPVIAFTKENPNNFNDKEDIWADRNPNSPFFGRVFVSWTQYRSAQIINFPSEPTVVTYSADGGLSFTAGKQLSPAGSDVTKNGRQGSAVRSGPDGSVYVAWEELSAQVVAISRDGGNKWSRPITIGPVADLEDPIPGANFRTDSFLELAVDPRAGNSTLYAAWVNRTNTGGRVVVSTSSDKGQTWGALQNVSTAGEGYAFFQGLDVAPNGRVDVAYQALTTTHPNTFGTGNATIDAYYVENSGSGWSAPVKITTASSDPAASAQNDLTRQFWGDYNTLVSSNANAWFIYTDSRHGAGCTAVDNYQKDLTTAKPAPENVCPAQFGNTDAFVSVITP